MLWSLAYVDYLEYSEIDPLQEGGVTKNLTLPFEYSGSTYREVTIQIVNSYQFLSVRL